MKRQPDRERGATLVEFALILPLLMALILGMFTGGLAYNRKISMTNAVREGTRFGATLDSSPTWASNVRARVVELSGGDLVANDVCVKLVRVSTSSTSTPHALPDPCPFTGEPAIPAGTPTNPATCLAKVWARRTSDLEAMFFTTTLTLTAKAINRYERACPAPAP